MNPPNSCSRWVRCLRNGSQEHNRILKNFLNDECVPEDVEEHFFSKLSCKPDPESGNGAIKQAVDIINDDRDTFLFSGEDVPDTAFRRLIRIRQASVIGHWIRALDSEEKRLIRRRTGIKANETFEDFSVEDAREFARAVEDILDSWLPLGGKFDIVWVTNYEASHSELSDMERTLDRLGLDHCFGENFCIVLEYDRSRLEKELVVPRVLDAPTYSQFRPETDCDADSGTTHPVSPNRWEGLPEAIHKACSVPISNFDLRPLEETT